MKNQSKKKIEQIIENLDFRVNSYINDCNSYLYLKSINEVTEKVFEDNSLGGGNFIMASGLFGLVNFLSKINAVLDGHKLYSDEEVKEIKKIKNKLMRENKEHRKLIKTRFMIPKFGTIKKTEVECFESFIGSTNKSVNWGIKADEARKVWDQYRNKLSHLAIPGSGVAANNLSYNIGFDQHISNYSDPANKIFYSVEGHYYLCVEAFYLSIKRIYKEHLKPKITLCKDNKVVNSLSLLVS